MAAASLESSPATAVAAAASPVEEPAPAPAAAPAPAPVEGSVIVRYNHYKSSFPILDGVVSWEKIDEEYCLSMVFPGKPERTLKTIEGKVVTMVEGGSGWGGLDDAGTYILTMEEDPELRDDTPQKINWATPPGGSGGSSAIQRGARDESCSCIEGNPCAERYNCLDWENREAVAKAARARKGMRD